jgi:hypothetical protein
MSIQIGSDSRRLSKSNEDNESIDKKLFQHLIVQSYKDNRKFESLLKKECSLTGILCSLFITIFSFILIFLLLKEINKDDKN